ncbi:MAG: hypothetical protein ABSA11_11575 [Candidatus Bathyarchaeia archaeon]
MNVKHVLDSLNLDQIRTQLENLYHSEGPGRKPFNPLSMLKAQLTNTCYRYPATGGSPCGLEETADWRGPAASDTGHRATASSPTSGTASARRPTSGPSTNWPCYRVFIIFKKVFLLI